MIFRFDVVLGVLRPRIGPCYVIGLVGIFGCGACFRLILDHFLQ